MRSYLEVLGNVCVSGTVSAPCFSLWRLGLVTKLSFPVWSFSPVLYAPTNVYVFREMLYDYMFFRQFQLLKSYLINFEWSTWTKWSLQCMVSSYFSPVLFHLVGDCFQAVKGWREWRTWHFLFLIPDDVSGSSHLSSTIFLSYLSEGITFAYLSLAGAYLEVGHMWKGGGRHVKCVGGGIAE